MDECIQHLVSYNVYFHAWTELNKIQIRLAQKIILVSSPSAGVRSPPCCDRWIQRLCVRVYICLFRTLCFRGLAGEVCMCASMINGWLL